jgi:hypothetical protein
MAVWSVKIVAGANPGDPATFVAQNQPSAPVGTIYADPGDIISWDNTTPDDHQPVQTSVLATVSLPLGSLVWDPVAPGHQTPGWAVAGSPGTSIAYTCLLHANESATVVVTPVSPAT